MFSGGLRSPFFYARPKILFLVYCSISKLLTVASSGLLYLLSLLTSVETTFKSTDLDATTLAANEDNDFKPETTTENMIKDINEVTTMSSNNANDEATTAQTDLILDDDIDNDFAATTISQEKEDLESYLPTLGGRVM